MSLYADEVYDESDEEPATAVPWSSKPLPMSTTALEEDEEEEDELEESHYDDEEEDGVPELKEQMYQSKLAELKRQLMELQRGQLPEYSRRLRRLDAQYRERIKFNANVRELELETIEKDFLNEKRAAAREFEEQKVYLREQLIAELEEKQRNIEADRFSMELSANDNLDLKPISTRKLRRRVNDNSNGNSGYGVSEKRRAKPATMTGMCFQLDDSDIHDDLKIINKNKVFTKHKSSSSYSVPGYGSLSSSSCGFGASEVLASSGSSSSPAHSSASGNAGPDLRVEDGKLFYERRWFRRGQSVQVEHKTQPMHRYPATITAIGPDDILVRKNADNSKVRIYLNQLAKGKITIKRRAT